MWKAPTAQSGLSRRQMLAALGAGAVMAMAPGALFADDPVAPRRPNVIVILADDLGFADVGFQGSKVIPTPNIDSIANNGVRFTNAYVTAPVCSPSRAGLITGRYQQRFGYEYNLPESQRDHPGLPLEQTMVPELLREAGYVTGHIGKWHLGMPDPYRPWKRGFTDTYSFLGGGHDYFKQGDDESVPNDYRLPTMRDGKIDPFKGYLTDALSAEAVEFVKRRKDRPYFLYLAYNAPHAPLQVPDNYLERVASITDERRRTYAAMVCAIDDGVGQLLQALRETNQEENTLIFFLSDNGGPSEGEGRNGSSNWPLRGAKGNLWEGGIRVPFAAQWKGKIAPKTTFAAPVSALDITATAVALANAKVPEQRPLDGVNLLPHLNGQATGNPHDALYWRIGKRSAVRQGDWKLILIDGAASLYNLATDPGEKTDLAAKEPAKLEELKALYAAWDAQLIKPLWEPRPAK